MAHLLIIDDDPDVGRLLTMMLKRVGHTPTVCYHATDGLKHALAHPPNLIVLDLMMPDMDGYDLIKRLRAESATAHIPILVITARGQAADKQAALEAGANAYLRKPIDPKDLTAQVQDLLTSRPTGLLPSAASTVMLEDDPNKKLAHLHTVLSVRGGAGGTTLAVTLAGALTRLGRRVCLVELSPLGSALTLHFRLRPRQTWADLPARPAPKEVYQTLVRHDSGLGLLMGPLTPSQNSLSAETASAIFTALRTIFTDVVVDSAPVFDPATLLAAQASHTVLLPCQAEVSSVHAASLWLKALSEWGLTAPIQVALSAPTSDPPALPPAALEKALGRAPNLVIPFDKHQSAALAQGAPLVFSQPNAPLPLAVAQWSSRWATQNPPGA